MLDVTFVLKLVFFINKTKLFFKFRVKMPVQDRGALHNSKNVTPTPTPTTLPSVIDRGDIQEFDSLKHDSNWDDFEEAPTIESFDYELTTKLTTTDFSENLSRDNKNKISTEKSLIQPSSTKKSLVQVSSSEKSSVQSFSDNDSKRRHYSKVLLNAVVEMPWLEDQPQLNETSRYSGNLNY